MWSPLRRSNHYDYLEEVVNEGDNVSAVRRVKLQLISQHDINS